MPSGWIGSVTYVIQVFIKPQPEGALGFRGRYNWQFIDRGCSPWAIAWPKPGTAEGRLSTRSTNLIVCAGAEVCLGAGRRVAPAIDDAPPSDSFACGPSGCLTIGSLLIGAIVCREDPNKLAIFAFFGGIEDTPVHSSSTPRALAAASAAFVRELICSRSCSAKAASMCSISFEACGLSTATNSTPLSMRLAMKATLRASSDQALQ